MVSIVQADAFATPPFQGNPAGVCLLPEPRDDGWMQAIAREMDLPETAFLRKEPDGYGLRWFTPQVEVELCGHATLASAHVLWEEGHLKSGDPARFHTRSGLLTANLDKGWIEMDFPAEPEVETEPPPLLAQALGVKPAYVGKNRFDYLVEVESEETLRAMRPDFSLLRDIPTRGVIVTSRPSSAGFDFVSRFFAPRVGIDEDLVTGSAHCCLGPFWRHRLGKSDLVAYQASARGGVVRVRARGDRTHLAGQAVTVLRRELA